MSAFHRLRPATEMAGIAIKAPCLGDLQRASVGIHRDNAILIARQHTFANAGRRQPRFSAGHGDSAPLETSLSTLLSSSGGGGRWALTQDGQGLERSFKFKTFAKTWDFMTAVSLQCKLKNHHPEWSNAFNTTFIRWTTHDPRGLSAIDLELAATCDSLGREFGEVDQEQQGSTCELENLAERASNASGDCCAPKP